MRSFVPQITQGLTILTSRLPEDPQVQATGVLESVEFPGLPRAAPVARVPVWLSGTPPSRRGRPPLAGEHTDAILGQLGYGTEEIAELRRKGVV